jgi:hypothetical protein
MKGPSPAGSVIPSYSTSECGNLGGPADPGWAAGARNDPSLDPVNDMRQWRAAIQRHESFDELILWFEHDLFDQPNLISCLRGSAIIFLRPSLCP